jgi:predicted amidophosphoribosyltransferase
VAGVFRTTPALDPIRGTRVLLVDDVLTTGATAGECARVLAEAGAPDVALVSFARALDARRSDPR